MRKRSFPILLAVFIWGCQSELPKRKYWVKPDTTLEQAVADCKTCRETARGKAHAGHYDRYQDHRDNSHLPPLGGELEEANRDFDELHAFRSCMRSLGYEQVPDYRLRSRLHKANRFGGGDIQHLAGE